MSEPNTTDIKNFDDIFSSAVLGIRLNHPLIHCITNGVALNDCANILLALGARPVMADSPEDCKNFTSHADALSVNLGMLTKDKRAAILRSSEAAFSYDCPVLLDPVGISLSPFRSELAQSLLKNGYITILKGNTSEIAHLADLCLNGGMYSTSNENLTVIAQTYHCIAAATGEVDIAADEKKHCHIHGGSPLLPMVTATGCMTGVVTAAFMAIMRDDPLMAAACGLYAMKEIGARAAELTGYPKTVHPGSFHIALFDAAADLSNEKGELLKL